MQELLDEIYSADFYVFKEQFRNQSRLKYKRNSSILKKALMNCLISVKEFNELSEKLDSGYKADYFKPNKPRPINPIYFKINDFYFVNKDKVQDLSNQGYGLVKTFEMLGEQNPNLKADLEQIGLKKFSSAFKELFKQSDESLKETIRECLKNGESRYSIAQNLAKTSALSERALYAIVGDIEKELVQSKEIKQYKRAKVADKYADKIKELLLQGNSVYSISKTLYDGSVKQATIQTRALKIKKELGLQ